MDRTERFVMKKVKKRATVKDVAERAGVTIGTVSHVLNGTASISEQTVKRVHQAIEELGYIPNMAARAIRNKDRKNVGILVPKLTNSFYTLVVSSYMDEADIQDLLERGISVILADRRSDFPDVSIYCINRVTEIHRPNGVSTYNTYNARNQIVTLKNTCDENGRLLSSKEQEENSGLTTYEYTYDAVGNRLSYVKHTETTTPPNKTDVAESAFYQYNDANQLVSAELFDGKKNTTVTYTYDANGNLISEIGKYGTDQVETYYDYTVENRLQAVYDGEELLMAAAYDGDGNRVIQLNYNLHTDEDWKDNNGNGKGNNKDNAGSGNNKENSKSEGTDDAGYGNATNAEEHNSQNQSGILFPIAEEISQTETDVIAMIKTTGKEKNYELIEYISNVNTQYTQVLMELNENGAMDAAYTYGTSRLTEDRFTGESSFYLYDPAGNVAGITDQDDYLWQSYRYDAFGNATFGSPQYDNEYTCCSSN